MIGYGVMYFEVMENPWIRWEEGHCREKLYDDRCKGSGDFHGLYCGTVTWLVWAGVASVFPRVQCVVAFFLWSSSLSLFHLTFLFASYHRPLC
jgi:hypothetical protein